LQHELEELIEAQASNPRIAVIEAVHAAAFGSSSALGHSLYARPADLPDVDAAALRAFLAGRLTGKHIVVAGVSEWCGWSTACLDWGGGGGVPQLHGKPPPAPPRPPAPRPPPPPPPPAAPVALYTPPLPPLSL
jgi:hypothetical protein